MVISTPGYAFHSLLSTHNAQALCPSQYACKELRRHRRFSPSHAIKLQHRQTYESHCTGVVSGRSCSIDVSSKQPYRDSSRV